MSELLSAFSTFARGLGIFLAVIAIILLLHWLEIGRALCQDALIRGRTDTFWARGNETSREIEADIKKYCLVIGEVRQWEEGDSRGLPAR